MRSVSAEEMRRLDWTAIEEFGIPSLYLMENAGRGVADIIAREYRPCRVAVFAGKGNNGGDGFVVARHLADRGFSVQVLLLEDPEKLKPDPLANLKLVQQTNIPVHKAPEGISQEEITRIASGAELIVDAIFGVGLNSAPRGIFDTAIRAVNKSGRSVVSIDIPSGLDSDSGKVHGVAVKATRTVTLALPKTGLSTGQGPEYAGTVEVVDIGIPQCLLAPFRD